MLRFLLTLALSATMITACDPPDEPTCAQGCAVTMPTIEPDPEPAEFGDACSKDSECANDDGNLVCSNENCTMECSSWEACSQFNYEFRGYKFNHTCEEDDAGRFVCVPDNS